jgi:hypothetical protein
MRTVRELEMTEKMAAVEPLRGCMRLALDFRRLSVVSLQPLCLLLNVRVPTAEERRVLKLAAIIAQSEMIIAMMTGKKVRNAVAVA